MVDEPSSLGEAEMLGTGSIEHRELIYYTVSKSTTFGPPRAGPRPGTVFDALSGCAVRSMRFLCGEAQGGVVPSLLHWPKELACRSKGRKYFCRECRTKKRPDILVRARHNIPVPLARLMVLQRLAQSESSRGRVTLSTVRQWLVLPLVLHRTLVASVSRRLARSSM